MKDIIDIVSMKIDYDSVYCPISYLIMLHPIRAEFTDGTYKYYELKELHDWVFKRGKQTCPVTMLPFHSFKYDKNWKSSLDANFNKNEDRYNDSEYENINIQLMETQLRSTLTPSFWPNLSFFSCLTSCISPDRSDEDYIPRAHI